VTEERQRRLQRQLQRQHIAGRRTQRQRVPSGGEANPTSGQNTDDYDTAHLPQIGNDDDSHIDNEPSEEDA
jgi:hypothetical protein